MEIYTGTKDIVTKETISFRLLDSHAETFYGKRIFCTYINISILSAYCICCNDHTFNHLVWITFHYGAIHKCTRVTLITVTYNVADFFFLTGYLRPFLTGRETSSATSTKSGFRYFIDNLLRRHIKESFCHSLKSADCNIFINRFCIDISTVFKNDSCLLIQERNIRWMWTDSIMITIKQSAYRLTFHNSTLYDFLTVFHLYMHILIIVRLDFHKRSKFAKSLASGLNNTDMRNIFLHFHAYPIQILA